MLEPLGGNCAVLPLLFARFGQRTDAGDLFVRGGGFALLEKEYLIKYCRRDGTVYGAGAGGVCVSVL